MKKELGISILLVVVCSVTALKNPAFLSATNLANLANIIGLYGIFSIGLGLVIITGGIDLSVGSMFALGGVLLAIALRDWNWPWPLAACFVILVPMILGWVHGLLITRLRIQAFIVTLCGLLLYRGLARYIAKDTTKGFGTAQGFEALRFLAKGRLFRHTVEETVEGVAQTRVVFEGIPMPFIVLIVVTVVMWFVLHRSVYGRYLLAVGRNEEATRFSGINTRRLVASTYIVGGLLTGISSVLFAFYTNSISPSTHGNFYELYGIAAAVLGGCSLRGGEGSIIGIVIGTALLQVLQNLVNLLGIDSSLNFAVIGAVVLVGVLADQILQQRSATKQVRARH
ncbi:MAG: ABC transporter permease [Verrucomicrobia bacterium]|nr:MAG: ABC transporter permease [Verrucomicrobiota bacterium]